MFKLRAFVIITLLLFSINTNRPQVDEETQLKLESEYNSDFIIDVTEQDFNEVNETHEFVLTVFYYIEPTHYCRRIFNILESLKGLIESSGISVIKVNARLYPQLFLDQKFKVLPGLLWKEKGKPLEKYESEQTLEELELFFKKRTLPLVKDLKNSEEVGEYLKKSQFVVFDFSIKPYPFLELIAKELNFILFARCIELECYHVYFKELFDQIISKNGINLEEAIDNPSSIYFNRDLDYSYNSMLVIINNKDPHNNKVIYNPTNPSDLLNFIADNSFPLISEINERSLMRMMKGGKETLILLDDSSKSNYETLVAASAKLSTYNLTLMYSDPSQSAHKEIMNQLGVTESRLPEVVILLVKESLVIYKFDFELLRSEETPRKPITKHSLINFANDWKYDVIKPIPKSKPIPRPVKDQFTVELVAHNFVETIGNKEKAVLVKFYSKECKFCAEFGPTYEELARILRKSNSLIIAQIDVQDNYVPVPIKGLPTVILYPKGEKKSLLFEYDRNLSDLISFIYSSSNSTDLIIDEDDL